MTLWHLLVIVTLRCRARSRHHSSMSSLSYHWKTYGKLSKAEMCNSDPPATQTKPSHGVPSTRPFPSILTPSLLRSRLFSSMVMPSPSRGQLPLKPPRPPPAATTRWHGTRGAKGLRRSAPPIARGDDPRCADISPYVDTRPRGICSSSASTRFSKGVRDDDAISSCSSDADAGDAEADAMVCASSIGMGLGPELGLRLGDADAGGVGTDVITPILESLDAGSLSIAVRSNAVCLRF